MYPGHASFLLVVGFPLLALLLLGALLWGFRLALRERGDAARGQVLRLALAVVVWLGLVSAASLSGVVARMDARPPPFALLLLATITVAVTLARSSVGRQLGEGLPLAALVGFHAFRLPLELLMHQAATEQVMPPQMTFTGLNFDIVTGVTAIAVAVASAKGWGGQRLVWAWNLMGTVLLAVVVIIAVASTPLFAAFGQGVALNTFVAYFPFITLPTVMVALALAGHLVLWRRLGALGGSPASRALRAG